MKRAGHVYGLWWAKDQLGVWEHGEGQTRSTYLQLNQIPRGASLCLISRIINPNRPTLANDRAFPPLITMK